jgi:hypothetical protein
MNLNRRQIVASVAEAQPCCRQRAVASREVHVSVTMIKDLAKAVQEQQEQRKARREQGAKDGGTREG